MTFVKFILSLKDYCTPTFKGEVNPTIVCISHVYEEQHPQKRAAPKNRGEKISLDIRDIPGSKSCQVNIDNMSQFH